MKLELKQKIDDIWLNSDYGNWCKAIADDDFQKANIIKQKIFDSGYLMIEMLEDKLANEIVKVVKNESEIDEYLQLLENENSKLVGVLIRQELFYKVSNLLQN